MCHQMLGTYKLPQTFQVFKQPPKVLLQRTALKIQRKYLSQRQNEIKDLNRDH